MGANGRGHRRAIVRRSNRHSPRIRTLPTGHPGQHRAVLTNGDASRCDAMSTQPDLFTEIEQQDRDPGGSGTVAYAVPPCGFHIRAEMFHEWCATYGNF